MKSYSFIASMPDDPGSLEKAATVITHHGGNITRIHYDHRIDPSTVFFELRASPEAFRHIEGELRAIGYLRTSLAAPSILKFTVRLPHRPGALREFLGSTTAAGANIAFIDFDEKGRSPGSVTMTLSLEESSRADVLLTRLQSLYPLEIHEYDTTGEHLDDTVFYLRFAQKLRQILGSTNDSFLMRLLGDINHIVQELAARGKDPGTVFESILRTGRELRATSGDGFYADIQRFSTPHSELLCCQVPCGGNVYIVSSRGESLLVDTGYGCYRRHLEELFTRIAHEQWSGIGTVLITHGDADHSGGAGFFDVPVLMSRGTLEVIRKSNRAYGSRVEGSILEEVYTRLINLFSDFTPAEDPRMLPGESGEIAGIFPVTGHISVGDLRFDVLGSLGGHLHGQVYLNCPEEGLLFTADSVINFASLTPERKEYANYADFLMTSVNVDSDRARTEREGLLAIARSIDERLASEGRRCLICGGHGAVSVLENGRLAACGEVVRHVNRQ